MSKSIAGGTVHRTPRDLKEILLATPLAVSTWQDTTPLARNEWICWIESAKKLETRNRRLQRAKEELSNGKRRPCCWAGCIHR